ncbi:MAG: translation initiation factor IF-2 [Bacteroidota bacterium]
MEGKKKAYRLFKVAKELNVGTTMLVEHLAGQGQQVDDSPNTKLSTEQYDLLLKEFASEKLMKERADQLSEKRKEDVRMVGTPVAPPPADPPPKEETPEKDLLSAEQLRSTVLNKGPESSEPVVEEAPQTTAEEEAPAEEKKEVVVEKEEPVVEQVPEKPEAKEEQEEPVKLKVVGKIDLDQVGSKGKPKSKKKAAEPEAKKEEPAPEPQKEPEKEPEKEPVVEAKKPAPEPEAKEPVKEAPTPEVEKPVAEPEAETAEEKPATEEEKLIRAKDNMPQLSGLKVMGKIELPTGKGKKSAKPAAKKEEKPTDKKTEDGDADKKRRRRRKRKRKSAVKEDVGGSKGGNDSNKKSGKGKKEKPTAKEVDKSIRDTLSRMSQGASRSRQRLRRAKRDADAARREEREMREMEDAKVIDVTEFITANEFANLIDVPVNNIITKSFQLGMMISINQRLDAEVMSLIGEEYGFEVNFVDVKEEELEIDDIVDAPEDLEPRSPIITVMGHVDHGKTTLLDYLRNANVTSQEAGGITQHIGAYEVTLKSGRNVTFLDTPGHEAFTAMRARGAQATDVAIIVIAADDAVMPQTKEAINHAQAAEVPMIFAINKVDKAGADPEKIKTQLAEMNLMVEDWGGKYQSQEISALKGQKVDELLEKVILEADLLELKANPNRPATGSVIESRLDKGRGNVATMMVQNGTLKVGDEMVAGIHYGKVRALINQNGQRLKEAGPSMPVQVLGLSGQPQAGDRFYIFSEDGKAKSIAQRRSELFREQQFRQTKRITLEEIGRRRAIGNFKELNVILRGDVDGSVEALSGSLLKLSTEEVQVNMIAKGTGAITEADINLAIASEAVVIAFNVRPNAQARALAQREEVDIRMYSVIYNAINDVKDALEGLLSPEITEEIVGTAEVLEVFKITRVGNVAGSQCTTGKIRREDPIRIIRDGVVIYDSKLSSLKRFKDDAKEVVSGQEFGFMVENYNDIKVGDVLESYRINETRRKL